MGSDTEGTGSGTDFWRLVGVLALGGLAVLLLTPMWTLPFGRSSLVVQGPSGDRYTTHYNAERPIAYEDLSRNIPYMEGWTRYNATKYISQTEYLEPKGQSFWIYRRGNTSVHLMLIWSNKIGELHIPSVCYTYQGYKVMDEEPREVVALNTSRRRVSFHVNELWTRHQERDETREVYYFFIKYGFGAGGREAYFVRIECLDVPREEAREINEEFARQVFLNVIDIYGVGEAPEGGTLLEYLLSVGLWGMVTLVSVPAVLAVAFFWLPGRLRK